MIQAGGMRNVYLLAACQASMMTGQALMLAAAPFIGLAIAPDKSLATLPIGLQFCATLIATVPASFFMKRFGRRSGFLCGVIIGIAGSALAAYATWIGDFVLFCSGLVLNGVFSGFGIYYRFAAADAAGPDYRSRAISYVVAGGVIAALLGPNLARFTADAIPGVPFTGSFIGLTVVYALTLVALLFVDIPPPTEQERAGRGRPLGIIARQPAFVVAVLCGMVGYAVMNLIMIATPLAMHDHHYPFGDAAFIIQWHMLGMYAPSFFTGRLITRFGVLQVMQWGVALCAVCSAVNLVSHELWALWVALVALGVGWNFMFVAATTLVTQTYVPEEKAKAQAVNDLLVGIATTMTAMIVGPLHGVVGWEWLNVVVVPFLAVVAAGVYWLQRRRTERFGVVASKSAL